VKVSLNATMFTANSVFIAHTKLHDSSSLQLLQPAVHLLPNLQALHTTIVVHDMSLERCRQLTSNTNWARLLQAMTAIRYGGKQPSLNKPHTDNKECNFPHFRGLMSDSVFLKKKNPWSESTSELYLPSDRRLSAK
jgi:hypothetical protein